MRQAQGPLPLPTNGVLPAVNFFLNGEARCASPPEAAVTLLRHLRTEAGLPGTKEGCASGDCGACTVLVARPGGEACAVNACITPLGSVAGCGVLTVEGLAEPGRLHPAQQAMVDHHGSQCGFCTPGFVMSLAGLCQRQLDGGNAPASRAAVTDAIAGNLCRCTGYRPIIDAGLSMHEHAPCPLRILPPNQVGASAGLPDTEPLFGTERSRYFQPRSERALQRLMRAVPGARLVAGGTDLMLEASQGFRQFEAIIDLSRVAGLSAIGEADGHVEIGACATYAELEQHPALASPALRAVLHRFGSQQIRNRAGLGGNLANGSPIADLPPILLCWEASVELVNGAAERRRLPMEDFHLGYRRTALRDDEYIRSVRVPLRAMQRPHRFTKLSKRFEDDISSVMMAVALDREGDAVNFARIAYGGMAATPARASAAEAVLLKRGLGDAGIEATCEVVAEEFQPLTDVRASADYRRAMAAALLDRALREIRGDRGFDVWSAADAHGAASRA